MVDINEAYRITTGREPPETDTDTCERMMRDWRERERQAQAKAEKLNPHLPSLNQRLCGQGYGDHLRAIEGATTNARAVLRGICVPSLAARDLRDAAHAAIAMADMLDEAANG